MNIEDHIPKVDFDGVDFDALWDQHKKEHLAFTLAVICSKCKVTDSVCSCSKHLWILQEKNRLFPGSVEPPEYCHWCKEGMFDSWIKMDKNLNQYFPVCKNCLHKA